MQGELEVGRPMDQWGGYYNDAESGFWIFLVGFVFFG